MKKVKFLLIILLIYILAFGIGFLGVCFINNLNIVLKILIWDIISTIVVYIFSIIFKNSSVYDPYWSVVPPLVCIYLMIHYHNYTLMHFVTLFAIFLWSVRLTGNWIIVTSGFDYEDWRYRMFRNKANGNKFMWFIYNFCGIHLVPTLFVFLGMLPLFYIFKNPINYFSIIGIVVIILGVVFEFFADKDLRAYLKETKENKACRKGLWKYSRHPNYLGEMTVWVGIFLVMITNSIQNWYYIVGMLGMIFMFNVISIPMAEKRNNEMISDWQDYKKEAHLELILPVKHRA